jgi:putative transposase
VRLAPDDALDTHVLHQSGDCATGDFEAFPIQLTPDLAHAVDAPVLSEDTLDLGPQRCVAPCASRQSGRIGPLRQVIVVGGRGDRQNPADRLDPVPPSLQGLRRIADLRGNRHDCLPARSMLTLIVENQAHRTLAHFGKNLFVVLLIMLHPTQELEPPEIPERFISARIHVLLRREGWQVIIKKTSRIYIESHLQLRNKRPKRRVKAELRDDRKKAVGPNDVWAMEFVYDQVALGNKLRILTIVDFHSRFCPVADTRSTYRDEDVVQTLARFRAQVGYPRTIRVDNGSEFISCDPVLRAYANDVTLDFSRPGKPTENGFIDAFNSKLRLPCPNAHWFMNLPDAREALEDWRRQCNEDRPHSAIGYNVSIALHNPGDAASPSP